MTTTRDGGRLRSTLSARPRRAGMVPAVVGLLAVALLSGVVAVAAQQADQTVRDQAQVRLRSNRDAAIRALVRIGNDYKRPVEVSAASRSITSYLLAPTPASHANMEEELSTLARTKDAPTGFVTDAQGRVAGLYPTQRDLLGRSFAFRDWFKGVSRTGKPYISEAFRSAAGDRPLVVAVAAPVRDGGRVLGYAGVVWRLETVRRLAEGTRKDDGVQIRVTDQSGQVLTGSQALDVDAQGEPRSGHIDAATQQALAGRNVDIALDGSLGAAGPVPGLGWTVTAVMPMPVALAAAGPFRQSLYVTLGVALLLVLVFTVVAVVVARRRVEERAATERSLKTQAKFEGLLVAAPDALLGVDDQGRIRLVNDQAERLFGYPREELLGQSVETLIPDRVRGTHPQHRLNYFRNPAVRPMGVGLDLIGLCKDGTEFPAEISLSAIDIEGGVMVTAAVRDITERKAFEEVVLHARDVAEQAALAQQEFLANMSHEIRTPMNAVIGLTSLLLDTTLDVNQRDYVETVRTSGEHLLTIINDILDYSKLEAGKLELEALPFAVRDWLRQSLDLIAQQANDKGLEIAGDIAPDVPEVVVGDPGRLRQVLLNLLSNAVKFTEVGEVVVRISVEEVQEDGVRLRVAVSDTGVGIEPARIEALFDQFTQADSTTTRVYGGTGLGLAICRQLVEQMGGTITMESTPGVGTTASFTFLGGSSAVVAKSVPADLAGQRMLVVDDNTTNRRILQSWAARHDMGCVSAESAEEALGIVQHDQEFAFAVLDLMMPGMDGAELGALMRVRLPGARLILLSSAGVDAREVAARGTFEAVLSKPANQEQRFDLMSRLTKPDVLPERLVPSTTSAFDLPELSRSLSILVVEDNPVNQKVALHLLARFGFRADVAASGREALAALELRPYDLVFMDVQMPEMDGLEATRQIRSRWPERPVRIVAMTANVTAADVRRCSEAGMDAFLGKPIDLKALADVLRGEGQATAAASGVPAQRSLIDIHVVARLREQIGDEAVAELVASLLADLQEALPQLAEGCQDRDREVLATTAHRLKSAARSLGADALGDLFDLLEREADASGWTRLEELVTAAEDQRGHTHDLLLAELPA